MAASRDSRRGYLLVVSGAVLFSVNAGVSRVIQTAGVDSTTLTTVRCTGTAVVLLAVVFARGEQLRIPRGRREVARVLGFGITGVALVQWFYFVAIDRLPVGIALLLEYTAPVLVALCVRFVYHERVRSRIWLGIALSLGGLALVAEVWSGLALDGLGVLAGLGAAVSLATYFLLGERSVSAQSPLHVITEAFIVASVFWNLVQPATRIFDTDLTRPTSLGGTLDHLHAPVWLLLTSMVLLGTAVPFLAELTALQHLTATEVTLVGMLEPVGATVLGWTWFRQTLSPAQTAGVVAILVGIALAQTARVSRRRLDTAVPGL
ncbi:MAG: DMT family transporter [Actinomycetota bacterium]|jgi:drug/metabolite transporter (DMT)-like permease|nr:DMT family transporter [Actinomycetota bacterium]